MNSATRFLILLIMLNFTIGIAGEAYNNGIDFSSTTIDNTVLQGEELYNRTTGERDKDPSFDPNLDSESSWGNAFTIGIEVTRLLLRGLIPIPITEGMAEGNVEVRIIKLINFFRGIMTMLSVLMLIFIFKNRKSD